MNVALWICAAGMVAGVGLVLWCCLGMASLQDDRWDGK